MNEKLYDHKCDCPNCWSNNLPNKMSWDAVRRYRNYLLNTARLYSDWLKANGS